MISVEALFPRGLLNPELYVGVISSVGAHVVRVNLAEAARPSGAHFTGGRYGRGEVGEFVLIEGQISLLLGRIVEVILPSSIAQLASFRDAGSSMEALGTVQLLGSIAMDTLRVVAGVESYPRLGDRVYAAPHQLISNLPVLMDSQDGEPSPVQLKLGAIDVALESTVSIKPEKLFGRHCAILGTTGGGKSWTTARILQECLKHRCKIILIDPTGEYRSLRDDHVVHAHLGSPTYMALGSQERSLPATSFVESDFLALFEPAGKVQGPKLRAAIRSLRLAFLRPDLATDGVILKAEQPKAKIFVALRDPEIAEKLDDPAQPFSVEKLTKQLAEECVYPDGRRQGGGADHSRWGGESGDFGYCLSLVTRINAVRSSTAFSCVFKSKAPSLTSLIDEFMAGNKRLLRICVSGVAYEFHAREIVANVVGRYLLTKARLGSFLHSPAVAVVDEAHNFLGRKLGSEDQYAYLDAFEVIAKEGRKYGLNLCLATQRPRDVTEGVLSQMGTLIVHRLTNDRDREVVERACGEIDRAASGFLPTLQPGEAAIIGVDFPIPMTIKMYPPTARPISDGPNYQAHWAPVVPSG